MNREISASDEHRFCAFNRRNSCSKTFVGRMANDEIYSHNFYYSFFASEVAIPISRMLLSSTVNYGIVYSTTIKRVCVVCVQGMSLLSLESVHKASERVEITNTIILCNYKHYTLSAAAAAHFVIIFLRTHLINHRRRKVIIRSGAYPFQIVFLSFHWPG